LTLVDVEGFLQIIEIPSHGPIAAKCRCRPYLQSLAENAT
jgi:hypothetical protein